MRRAGHRKTPKRPMISAPVRGNPHDPYRSVYGRNDDKNELLCWVGVAVGIAVAFGSFWAVAHLEMAIGL